MRRKTAEFLMRRYLLGDLPEKERVQVEGRYLADAKGFEQFLAVENDLIDAYVRDGLAGDAKQKFETGYLTSPERRERVAFARAFRQISALARRSTQLQKVSPWKSVWAAFSVERSTPQWALAAAAGIIVASGSWLLVQNRKLRAGFEQVLAQKAQFRREADTLRQHIREIEGIHKEEVHDNQNRSEVAKLETPIEPGVTLRLTPGVARGIGEQQKVLIIRPTTTRVKLQLVLDRDEYKTYEALLQTAEGQGVLRMKDLQSHATGGSSMVVCTLPARSIKSGDYIIQLTGGFATGSARDVGSYSFRALRK